MPYEAVPRALSRLARTARETIPIRAEREASRARMGLERAKTEFAIGQAKETTAHRERIWEAGKEPRALAAVKAKKEQEEIARGEETVTAGEFYRGSMAKDLHFIMKHVEPDLAKRLGIVRGAQDPITGKSPMLKHGEPVKRREMPQLRPELLRIYIQQIDPEQFVETLADEANKDQPGHEKAKEMIRKDDQVAIYKHGLKVLRRFAPRRGASPAEIAQYNSQDKYIQGQIKYYQDLKAKKEVERIKATEKKEGTVKFKHYDKEGKPHTEYISKSQIPAAEAEVRKQGGTMEKPEKKEKPGATEFNRLRTLIDKTTNKGEREPTSDQATMINEAAQAIGYEFKKVKGPLRADEKRWWWWDPETKERWTLRKQTGKAATGREKGQGYFGELKRPDGKIFTELSIGVNIDGKEMEIPSLVPTLTQKEIDYLLQGNEVTKQIVGKAVEHAKQRIREGKSPFAQKGEQAGQKVRVKIKPEKIVMPSNINTASKAISWLVKNHNMTEEEAKQTIKQYLIKK